MSLTFAEFKRWLLDNAPIGLRELLFRSNRNAVRDTVIRIENYRFAFDQTSKHLSFEIIAVTYPDRTRRCRTGGHDEDVPRVAPPE